MIRGDVGEGGWLVVLTHGDKGKENKRLAFLVLATTLNYYRVFYVFLYFKHVFFFASSIYDYL